MNLLVSKLPAPQDDDLAQGITDAIDMDSYRAEIQAAQAIAIAEHDAEMPAQGCVAKPEMALLSTIVSQFNILFVNIA